ncbi:MAG: hypothetical protein LBM69_05985 [Lachnospiraceae bacterium]|jgi:hypothetical protein|nr:hypothetical protein [Lachnospiraceae bacterium]
MRLNAPNLYQQITFGCVEATIIQIEPTFVNINKVNGCMLFFTVEDTNGRIFHFLVSQATYVLDYVSLHEGLKCNFYYRENAPLQAIEPPQYKASVIALSDTSRSVYVGYFNQSLVNTEDNLQIRLDSSVPIVGTNNQVFPASPANQNLVVVYDTATKSIPAQIIPLKIVVLCR